MQQVDFYEAIDQNTLKIKLKNPFPGFLDLLSMSYYSVVPKEVVVHFGNQFRSNPIGTGLFYFGVGKKISSWYFGKILTILK